MKREEGGRRDVRLAFLISAKSKNHRIQNRALRMEFLVGSCHEIMVNRYQQQHSHIY